MAIHDPQFIFAVGYIVVDHFFLQYKIHQQQQAHQIYGRYVLEQKLHD